MDLLLGLQSIKTNQIITLDVFPVKKTLHVIFLQIFLLSSEEMRVKIVKNAVYLWSMLQIMIVHRLLRNICKSWLIKIQIKTQICWHDRITIEVNICKPLLFLSLFLSLEHWKSTFNHLCFIISFAISIYHFAIWKHQYACSKHILIEIWTHDTGVKFLRTPFLQNTSRRLLLIVAMKKETNILYTRLL